MKHYEGNRFPQRLGQYRVTVDGKPLGHVCKHSPDGFEWGYGGSGPADLALSILADCLGQDRANRLYQDFKWAFVAKFQYEGWRITSDVIENWAAEMDRTNGPVTCSEPDSGALIAHIEGKDGLD
jgi:hypothetical protein